MDFVRLSKVYAVVPILLTIIFLFTSCMESPQYDDDVVGTWQGEEWLVEGKPAERNPQNVTFTFRQDSTYKASYGNQGESGRWYVVEDKLYTLAEGQIKKMVRIQRMEEDTMVFDMNRVGTFETLKLVRSE